MNSSITTRAPSPSRKIASSASSASGTVAATVTPLPAARPSALTTIGAPSASTQARAAAGSVKVWPAAVGAPQAAQISLVKAFDASSRAASRPGPERRDAAGAQDVGDALGQRRLGADHDEVDVVLAGEGQHLVAVEDVERHAGRLLGDAGVAGRAPEPVALGVLREGPGQRMLAAAAAEDEDVHGRVPLALASLAPRVLWCAPDARKRGEGGGMELFEDARPGGNAPEFTVSEISGAVKRVIEGEFGRVRVRGEIGRISRPASGHLYLDLKDERAVLGAVVWKMTARTLAFRPEEGMEVVATGRLTTFPGSSKYQMVIEELAPAGVGALMAMLEKRKQALAAEGLFDAARKRALPYLPEVIGVITSPSGAVIRDILHRLRERFPRPVLIWPVTVQGERCAAEVAAAIRGFNAIAPGGPVPRPDLLIVARGGGSIEDLWGFNEEIVVRAAAESRIPLISAVGHETDTTLIDFAADRRAPTPTAAAEMAVPVRLELIAAVAGLEHRRLNALARGLAQRLPAAARPRARACRGPRRCSPSARSGWTGSASACRWR